MNSYEKFYLEKMYPLQDGVMDIITKLNTPFFLTGGTALSRHYFNHRYSDDLDLFVNADDKFHQQLDNVLKKLSDTKQENNFLLETENIKRFESFAQIFIIHSVFQEIKLKIDFVNDISVHYGDFEYSKSLGKIDSWQNILSNKITAVFRFEPKDIADIWIISKNKTFNWKMIIKEAKTKEAGVEPEVIFNILKSFPIDKLNMIRWVSEPNIYQIKKDLEVIADDILYGKENSLF